MLAYDDFRVGSNEIRPLRRNGANGLIVDRLARSAGLAPGRPAAEAVCQIGYTARPCRRTIVH